MSSSTSASPCRRFTLAEIQSATKDFNDILRIGEGGFGKVYRGIITSEGKDVFVAIKRLDSMSDQGESEFRTEIEMLSTLRHCHLVSLIGYCEENKEMILVYEYMRHGTLYHHLHKGETPLDWVQRMNIAIGAGRGLDYLHTGVGTHHGIIHRDVKSSNILLDENFNALISDFGLSRIGPTNQSISFVDASVKGTFGYLDPEYFYTKRLTRKTDVFAFGVVLFELLSGRLPVDIRYGEDQCSLVRWTQKCIKERKLDQMVDSNIKGTIFPKCLRRFAQIACHCLHSVPNKRPAMTQVVATLLASLQLQVKSASSSGFNWKIHKYLVSETKQISDQPDTSSPKCLESNVEMPDHSWEIAAGDLINFTYDEIKLATRDFGDHTSLGTDKYGKLYKGWLHKKTYSPHMDDTGLLVVVKKIFWYKHFDPEMLKKHSHPNLVNLIGYCLESGNLLLVYEFTHTENFDDLLRSGDIARLPLATKVKIAIGIARAIVFLNNTENVSESELYRHKIMLDEDFTVKLSGYDATCWYEEYEVMDPEYYYPGLEPILLPTNLSGFRVVFAEILTGKRILLRNDKRKIDRFFVEFKEKSMDNLARVCFTSCNQMDSEERMVTILQDHDKLIRERLKRWLEINYVRNPLKIPSNDIKIMRKDERQKPCRRDA